MSGTRGAVHYCSPGHSPVHWGYLWDLLTKLELESLTANDNDTSSLSGDPMRIPGVLGHPALAVGL